MAAKRKSRQGSCNGCITKFQEEKECSKCKKKLALSAYSSTKMWHKSVSDRRCRKCMQKERGMWTCVQCKKTSAKTVFSDWIGSRGPRTKAIKKNDTTRCNACWSEQQEQKRSMAEKSAAAVQRRSEKTKKAKREGMEDNCRGGKRPRQ